MRSFGSRISSLPGPKSSLSPARSMPAEPENGYGWSPRTRLTATSFDLRLAPVAFGFFLGDAMGLDPAGRRFVPAFAVTGPAAAGPTDVLATEVG